MLDWGKRNPLSKGTFPADNPFEQLRRDVAAWAERSRQASWAGAPALPQGMLLCSRPPAPCLHLTFRKELTGQAVHFIPHIGAQEKAEQKRGPCCPRLCSWLLRRPLQGAAVVLPAHGGDPQR